MAMGNMVGRTIKFEDWKGDARSGRVVSILDNGDYEVSTDSGMALVSNDEIIKMRKGGYVPKSKKLTARQQAKLEKVLHEFKMGELHSGSKKGPIVKSRKQALAIGLAKARSMAKGGRLEVGVYRVGKPTRISPNLYEQKIVEIFDNGNIATASDYGRKLSDFKSQNYPIITKEQLDSQYKMVQGGNIKKNEYGVPLGYLYLSDIAKLDAKASGSLFDVSVTDLDRLPDSKREQVDLYLEDLDYAFEVEDNVPRYNPDLRGEGRTTENYLLGIDSGDEDEPIIYFFIDTQGYDYPRYITRLKNYIPSPYQMAKGGTIEVGDKVTLPEIKMKNGDVQFEKVENGEVMYISNGMYGVKNPKTNRIHQVRIDQIKMAQGGSLKPIPSGNKGLAKLPKDVRNKMGFMAKGGAIKELSFDNSNLYFYGFGRDTNGNTIVKVGFPNQKAFSIQINNPQFRNTYSLKSNKVSEISESDLNKIEKEVVAYVKSFGSAKQMSTLKVYSESKMAQGGSVDKELIDASAKSIYDKKGMMALRNTFLQVAQTDEKAGDKSTADYRRKVVADYQSKQPKFMAKGGSMGWKHKMGKK
jgi:hypothetical protein